MYSNTLKRKRSDPSISSSASSSPEHEWKRSANRLQIQLEPWLPRDNISDGMAFLNLRTRKRHRDNRPDQQTVYQSTYEKLFLAQKGPVVPSAQCISPAPSSPQVSTSRNTQRSLHNFWTINQPQPDSMDLQPAPPPRMQCEDCDTVFSMDSMSTSVDTEAACHCCSRTICDTCSMTNDYGRECLQCWTRRAS